MNAAVSRAAAAGQLERRQGWRRLAEDGRRCAERLIATDGRESVAEDELQFGLGQWGKTNFGATGDYGPEQLCLSFVWTAKAMLKAGSERRRAIMAGALKGLSVAVDQLLTDDGDTAAQAWKRQTGESD